MVMDTSKPVVIGGEGPEAVVPLSDEGIGSVTDALHRAYVAEGHCSSISEEGLWCGRLATDHDGLKHRAVRVEPPGDDVDPAEFVRPEPVVVEW